MKKEFITAIEKLGFRLNPANVHQLQFGNQLLNIYKPSGIFYENTSLVLEWLNKEDEDSTFTKLIKYIKEPNINEVGLLVTEATELHYKVDNNRNDIFQKLISTYGNEILMHKKSMLDFALKDSISYNVARSKAETYQRVLQDLSEIQKHLSSITSNLMDDQCFEESKIEQTKRKELQKNNTFNLIFDLEKKISTIREVINPFAYDTGAAYKINLQLKEISVLRKQIDTLLIDPIIGQNFAQHIVKEHNKLLEFGFKKSKQDSYLLEFKKRGLGFRFYYKSSSRVTDRTLYYSQNKKSTFFKTKEHFSAKEVIYFIENIDKLNGIT